MEARSQLRHRPALPLNISQPATRYSGIVPAARVLPFLALFFHSSALPQGVPPRTQPSAYHAQLKLPDLTIAADYLARILPFPSRPLTLSNYLVIEVALFPSPSTHVVISHSQFSLRLNGKKLPLLPQAAGLVAAEVKYPDWEPGPRLVLGGGIGDAGVILGPIPTGERFPGDPRGRTSRLPDTLPTNKTEPEQHPEAPTPHEFVLKAALPEGAISHPSAGLLYFAFKGKTKSIRSLELLYSGPVGSGALRLH